MTIQTDGRVTIPDKVRKALKLEGMKAFCAVENYGEDKILLTVLSRWEPNKNEGSEKKGSK